MPRSRSVVHYIKRFAGFALGVALFYAPFALLIRGYGLLFPAASAATSVADVHGACLRMPLGWLSQPWMWPALGSSAISWLPIAVLPLSAIAVGAWFCGWLCPAGALPEHLSRMVPDRFKFDFKRHVDIVPMRYGFLAGILLVPFVSTSLNCSLCNFGQMQNVVGMMFGDISGFAFFSTMGVIAAALWIIPLGLFTKGGRGWCMFLCPAGTAMGFSAWATKKLPWAFRVRSNGADCIGCSTCEDVCPTRAAGVSAEGVHAINAHLCNQCQDCVTACPAGALEYRTPR